MASMFVRSRWGEAPVDGPAHGPIDGVPRRGERRGDLLPRQALGPSGEEPGVGVGDSVLADGPRDGLDPDAAAGAGHAAHRVEEDEAPVDGGPPASAHGPIDGAGPTRTWGTPRRPPATTGAWPRRCRRGTRRRRRCVPRQSVLAGGPRDQASTRSDAAARRSPGQGEARGASRRGRPRGCATGARSRSAPRTASES